MEDFVSMVRAVVAFRKSDNHIEKIYDSIKAAREGIRNYNRTSDCNNKLSVGVTNFLEEDYDKFVHSIEHGN